MKWLVQKLDQLVSHRADDSGLSEQKRLEGLITRYKSMIPVIEVTMQKMDVYSRSYGFREDAKKVLDVLEELQRQTQEDKFPDTEEAVEALAERQEAALQQLDGQRPEVLSLLQRGKDLQRDVNCPEFLNDDVRALERGWTDAYAATTERLKGLREHLAAWREYKENRARVADLMEETEAELARVIPRETQADVREDLGRKQAVRDELRKATDDVLGKMRELADTLNSMAGEEKTAELEKEVCLCLTRDIILSIIMSFFLFPS